MIPANYCHMMYVEFDDGETLYYKPHTVSLLELNDVRNMMRVTLPKDAIELRNSNKDCPNIYWGYPCGNEPEGDLVC
jgi:hypothetical protein